MSNRDYDERSYREGTKYATKTTYRIPRDDDRASSFSSARGVETRIVRRVSPPREVERDIRIERYERSPDPPRGYQGKPRDDNYQLDRYIRTTEYYPPRAPVVVPRDEDEYQMVRRSDYEDQLTRGAQREEDYYYERRVREIDGRSSRRSSRSRSREKERRKRRSRSKHYSSDDDMVYVKHEVTEGRGGDENHRRHLLEGAVAGAGVAELLRHHRGKKGEDQGSTKSRVGRGLGAAAAGALGAEVVSRARSAYREKSRARSRAGSDDEGREERRRRRRSEERERSRSQSASRVKTLAGIGLGVAALAAAAGYAKHRHDQSKLPEEERGRSKSRTRRASEGEVDHKKNSKIAAAGLGGAAVAGLIERARSKSRAREGRSRSHNRLKTGIPIAAAGLGSAAIAGLWEKRQEQKAEANREAAVNDAIKRGRSASRSKSRHRNSSVYDGPPMASSSTPGLIEYGSAPVSAYTNNPQDYYRREPQYEYALPAAAGGAAAGYGASRAAEAYSPREYSPDRRRRDPSVSSDDGEQRRRRRHRRKSTADKGSRERSQSRARELATAGLAAGAAAFGMNEYNKRRDKKKAEEVEARERAEAEQNAAYDPNSPAYSQFSPMSPSHAIDQGAYTPESYYPHTNEFAPPPAGYAPSPREAAYVPANYAHAQASANPNEYYQPHQSYSPTQPVYSPPPPPVGANYAPAGATRGDENVSPGYVPDARYANDGLRGRDETPRPNDRHRRSKSVQFAGTEDEESLNGRLSPDDRRHRRRRRHRDYESSEATSDSDARPSNRRRSRRREKNDNNPPAPRAPSPAHSDSTIDLPPRFDSDGRPTQRQSKSDDGLSEKIESLLSGSGSMGKLFKNLKDEFLGGGGSSSKDRDRR